MDHVSESKYSLFRGELRQNVAYYQVYTHKLLKTTTPLNLCSNELSNYYISSKVVHLTQDLRKLVLSLNSFYVKCLKALFAVY